MIKESPCQFCKSRYLGCHSECVDYKVYTEEKDNVKEIMRRAKEEENIADGYKMDSTHRVLKRGHYKKVW